MLARVPLTVVSPEAYLARVAGGPEAVVALEALGAGGAGVAGAVEWSVYGIDGNNREIRRQTGARVRFALPMGVYRASVTAGGHSADRELIVNPGGLQVHRLEVGG